MEVNLFFLDNNFNLIKIVTSKNIINFIHEHELNGLIRTDIELDLEYTKEFIDNGIDFVGYYYEDNFYLHSIETKEENHHEDIYILSGRHIFFNDMLYGKYIRDVRPQNQQANQMLYSTIDKNTRWQTNVQDVTGQLSTNFYWQPPMEVVDYVVENFRLDYLPVISFDGQKINNYELRFAKKIGNPEAKRINFDSRVLELLYELDYSEIVTKLAVHGKGEEVGEGYGRRIDISDVDFSKNGVKSPKGSLYLEDESITATYGNDGQTPREGRVVFEDIEDVNELAEAGYQHYLEVSRPKMLFSAKVQDIGKLSIGDTVLIIRENHDIYYSARVHKIKVDMLNQEETEIELGDYDHFKQNKIERRQEQQTKSVDRKLSDRIARLQERANRIFDGIVAQWQEEFDQAKIDAFALIEEHRVRMTKEFNDQLKSWTDSFNLDMEEAYEKAEENYQRIEQRITNEIDTTRTAMENNIAISIRQTEEYAEEKAQEHAERIKNEISNVTSGHDELINNLQSRVTNLDTFLNGINTPIKNVLEVMETEFQNKIDNIDTWNYNLLRGTRFDEDIWKPFGGGTIKNDEEVPYYFYDASESTSVIPFVETTQEYRFEQGKHYRLSFDFQTYGHRSIDYIWIIAGEEETGKNVNIGQTHSQHYDGGDNLKAYWGSEYRRYYVDFSVKDRNFTGKIRVGVRANENELGPVDIKIRLPYLTEGYNTTWLYHQMDNTQNLEEVTKRLTELEHGIEQFITKTTFDNKTGEIEGRISQTLDTVDEYKRVMQKHENWINKNGSSILQTVDGFTQKAWKADIDNPNIIPHAVVNNDTNRLMWSIDYLAGSRGVSYVDWLLVSEQRAPRNYLAIRSPDFCVVAGEEYTFTMEAWENGNDSANTSGNMDYTFLTHSDAPNQSIHAGFKSTIIGRINGANIKRYEVTFTAENTSDKSQMLIGTKVKTLNEKATFRFRYPKLEVGGIATPFNNSFTSMTQRADQIALMYQGLDDKGLLTNSSVNIGANGIQIGSTYVGGQNIGSILSVSPSGIDAVAKAMRLSGDLFVQGDITSIAVNAIEGNFSRLFTSHLKADIIDGSHIKSNTIEIKHLTGYDAILEMLMARTVFSDKVMTKALDAIDINAGRVRTAILQSNVIKTDHISASTSLINKLFSSSARIDQLITKSHFTNSIKTMSLEAVEANISHVRGVLFEANMIEAKWLKSGTALIDRIFSSNAMFSRMMAKSGFVTALNTVTIDTDQITIRRSDGGVLISQGMQRFGSPIITKPFPSSGVEFDGVNYVTTLRGSQTFERAYGEHSGRWANFGFRVGLRYDSEDASCMVGLVVRPNNMPSGVNVSNEVREVIAYRSSMTGYTLNLRLPVPTFGATSYTLEFYRIGDANEKNYVQVRSERCWTSS